MKHILFSFLILVSLSANAQEESILSLQEYLGYIKMYHPIVKQANIKVLEGEAKLLKARGAIDPKAEVDFDRKRFKDKDYFNRLNTVFKIPTWYGIDFKGSYQYHNGTYLNPMDKLPDNGLYSIGVSVDVTRELLFNKRIATLKKAKLYQQETEAKNILMVNELLYDGIKTYLEWLKAYQEKQVYSDAIKNIENRLSGVNKSIESGDKPAIYKTETMIALNTQKVNYEKANLKFIKTSIALSNYLWIDDVPVEIQASMIPSSNTALTIDETLDMQNVIDFDVNNHPKIRAIDLKKKSLELEKRLKRNAHFPKIKLHYNFLNSNPTDLSYYEIDNYKGAVSISTPIFYRKQKADLRLAEYKIQSLDFDKVSIQNSIKNKFKATQQEIYALEKQLEITNEIIKDYDTLVKGEQRKFDLGESSLFLVNYREIKRIESQLKAIEIEYKILKSKGGLYYTINSTL